MKRKIILRLLLFSTCTHTSVETVGLQQQGSKANFNKTRVKSRHTDSIKFITSNLYVYNCDLVGLRNMDELSFFFLLSHWEYLGVCNLFVCRCVVAVFTCMRSHMSAQVAGLAETLPALVAEILSLPHERPQHP